MNHRATFWIAGFICSCLIMPAFSQSNEDSPEAVVQSYWAAMQAGDWAKCASLIHPDSLARVEERININTASIEELQRLPGIGPALASRIVEHRSRHGLFKRPQDIVIVRGMGAKLYRRIAHLIRI